ncbi:MAG: hypothetical protein ACLQBA_07180 [Candidatus Binataceae bacterium]
MVAKFDLKQGDQTLGTLTLDANGKVTLQHELTFDQLRVHPRVVAVDEGAKQLRIDDIRIGDSRKDAEVAFYDESGLEKLALRKDAFGFLDVHDPKSLAGLRTVLISPGSAPSQLVLELGPFEKVRVFAGRVLDLYGRVEDWLRDTSLMTARRDSCVTEGPYGTYNLPVLKIYHSDGREVATLVPTGAAVIAAEGRIEVVGSRDRQGLVYFSTGGPQIGLTVGSGPSATHTSRKVFRDVTSEGWYLLEDVRLGRAKSLDKSVFKDLLRGVADLYEL